MQLDITSFFGITTQAQQLAQELRVGPQPSPEHTKIPIVALTLSGMRRRRLHMVPHIHIQQGTPHRCALLGPLIQAVHQPRANRLNIDTELMQTEQLELGTTEQALHQLLYQPLRMVQTFTASFNKDAAPLEQMVYIAHQSSLRCSAHIGKVW